MSSLSPGVQGNFSFLTAAAIAATVRSPSAIIHLTDGLPSAAILSER